MGPSTPGRSYPAEHYVDLAHTAVVELLARELAAPGVGLQARIADQEWPTIEQTIDPHHLHDALRQAQDAGDVVHQSATATRGGRAVPLYTLPPGFAGATAVQRASARKRLLTARYLGWALGTSSRESVIGPAAERVVHTSLQAAAPHVGLRLANPTNGATTEFLGMRIPFGPLDNAAVLTPMTALGLPGTAVAVPMEVKNVRDWLYPRNPEVHQVLSKAARLQLARPDVPIVPVLIARRIHYTTFRMFKDLGALGHQAKRQYIGAVDGGEDRVNEVRAGLGLLDLVPTDGSADDALTRWLIRVLPEQAPSAARRWATTCALPGVPAKLEELRKQRWSDHSNNLIDDLRHMIDGAGLYTGKW